MKDLQNNVNYVAEELKALYNGERANEDDEAKNLYDYIADCLDVEYILNSAKKLIGVKLWVTLGGPNIYIDSRAGEVVGHWGSDCARSWVPSEICEEINCYFEEIF